MNVSLTISKGSQNQHMIDNRGPRNESEIGFPDYRETRLKHVIDQSDYGRRCL